jgi:hypothetical protein
MWEQIQKQKANFCFIRGKGDMNCLQIKKFHLVHEGKFGAIQNLWVAISSLKEKIKKELEKIPAPFL